MSRVHGFIGFVVSVVLWFHSFFGVNCFIVSCVLLFIGFVVSMVSWFDRFRGVYGLVVSCVSSFHRIRGVNDFMVS